MRRQGMTKKKKKEDTQYKEKREQHDCFMKIFEKQQKRQKKLQNKLQGWFRDIIIGDQEKLI